MSDFVFNLEQVKYLLEGLRMLQEKYKETDKKSKIDATLCFLRYQMVGALKKLEPFMRNEDWIKEEIRHEEFCGDVQRNNICNFRIRSDDKDISCGKSCRGKQCAECWKRILSELHGAKGHQCKS